MQFVDAVFIFLAFGDQIETDASCSHPSAVHTDRLRQEVALVDLPTQLGSARDCTFLNITRRMERFTFISRVHLGRGPLENVQKMQSH